MKGYKAFRSDLTCRGFQYEIGKTYELPDGVELKICFNGFHFCKTIGACYFYYPFPKGGTRICEVEALGDIESDNNGTKYCTNKIKICAEVTDPRLLGANIGSGNEGYLNIGSDNIGNYNTGGNNVGNSNTGDTNTGRRNSGCGNIGEFNTGNGNRGDDNSGNNNIGNGNTGDFNIGDGHTGFFCTQPETVKIFNVETNLTAWEVYDLPGMQAVRELMECRPEYRQEAFDELASEDKAAILSLPNFDAGIFRAVTGINVNDSSIDVINLTSKKEEK